MSPIKHSDRHEQLLVVISGTLFISLLYSVYALSISMFLIGALVVLDFDELSGRPCLRKDLLLQGSAFLSSPSWYAITFSFFIVLFGGLYSDHTLVWLERLRIKVPFLLFPLAMYVLYPIRRRTYLLIHLLFLLILAISTIVPLWHILTSSIQVISALEEGRPVDTPVSHIRYSLMISFASISAAVLAFEKELPRWCTSTLMWSVYVYLGIFLHLLAVRSGIVTWYLVSFFLISRHFLYRKKYLSLSLSIGLLMSLPLVAYQTIPSFQNRIDYMYEDLRHYTTGEWNAYSDAERILSMRAGWEIAKENYLWGVGPSNLKTEMQSYFYEKFDKDTFIMPHNQFLSVLAGSGLIGLSLFLMALILPVLYLRAYKEPLFLASQIILLTSFLAENTLETSVGVAFYLFFLLLGMNYLKGKSA